MRIVNALIFEIFGQIIGFFIIDKKYFGRKNSIILLFLFTSIRTDGLPHKRKRSCCCKMDERKRAKKGPIEKQKTTRNDGWLAADMLCTRVFRSHSRIFFLFSSLCVFLF